MAQKPGSSALRHSEPQGQTTAPVQMRKGQSSFRQQVVIEVGFGLHLPLVISFAAQTTGFTHSSVGKQSASVAQHPAGTTHAPWPPAPPPPLPACPTFPA